jgi:hypothetical protein
VSKRRPATPQSVTARRVRSLNCGSLRENCRTASSPRAIHSDCVGGFALRHDVQEAVLAEFARVGVDRFGEIALEKALHVGNDCVVDPRVASRVRTVNAFESDNSLSTKDPVDQKVIG